MPEGEAPDISVVFQQQRIQANFGNFKPSISSVNLKIYFEKNNDDY